MQRSELLTATARLVAQGETVRATNFAETPAALELERFGYFNGSTTINRTALGKVISADITYANNFDRIETIYSDGRIGEADPSTGSADHRLDRPKTCHALTIKLDHADGAVQRALLFPWRCVMLITSQETS